MINTYIVKVIQNDNHKTNYLLSFLLLETLPL